VYFVGDRPRTGTWGSNGGGSGSSSGNSGGSSSRDLDEKGKASGDSEQLDELSISGSHTSVRINWDGEEEPPEVRPSGWQSFSAGMGRFFSSGRVR
jgi:hypothetical protein